MVGGEYKASIKNMSIAVLALVPISFIIFAEKYQNEARPFGWEYVLGLFILSICVLSSLSETTRTGQAQKFLDPNLILENLKTLYCQ